METKYIAIFFIIMLTFNRLRLARLSATFKEKKKGEISKRWTYFLLFILYVAIIFGSILENCLLVETLNIVISSVGLIAYVIGLVGRNKAIKTLGKYWSTHIEVRDGQHIVQEGLYKYVRHPGYLSLIIETLSIPLMLNAYYSFLGVIFTCIPAVLIRAKFEDMEMEKKIGKKFSAYKMKTGAFIPKKLLVLKIPTLKKKHPPKTS
ncbi:MAG: hypothetical protein A2Y65_08885 [Deltaproteobacteria bacterium RBG_13_52_11]|nr:MAG: hypothetical protein A2Y65_08885 [Deltaproteobacteria bacterium RBG_13_52_11]